MTLYARSDPDATLISAQEATERGQEEAQGAVNPGGEVFGSDAVNTAQPVIENLDPERRRIRTHHTGFLARLIRRWLWFLLPRKLSPEELDHKREQERRAREFQALQADAIVAQRLMIGALDRMGLCFVRWDSEGNKKRINHVRFDTIRVEPDAMHYHVAMDRLPWGVSINGLINQETLDNIGGSVGRAVACRYTPESGVWYTVERASGRAGIPNRVSIDDLWEVQPASNGPLFFPVGVSHNARKVYADLGKMIHCLVGGTTGSGKTNFLHVIICTLIRRNTPEALKLVLVDLKGGLAFSRYEGVPHLMTHPEFSPDGIIQEREDVFKLLAWLITEGESRMRTLKSAGAEDIGQYNSRRKSANRLPYVVVVIDEWADMMQTDKKAAEGALVNVVQRMRSVGMHVILATQVPKSEVITGLIKGNLPARFGFSVPNLHASMAILDNRNAVGLQPTGRCVMQHTSERQVQTPYISTEEVREVINTVITGEAAEKRRRHDVTPRELMEWALENADGWLAEVALWRQVKDRRMPREELRQWLNDWEGETFVVNGSEYKVIRAIKPSTGNHESRRLVAVTGDQNGG